LFSKLGIREIRYTYVSCVKDVSILMTFFVKTEETFFQSWEL